MKYAEGPTVEAEIEIAAPSAEVWRWVVDIELPSRFSSEFLGADWADGWHGPELGAQFVGRSEHPRIGQWQTTCTLVGYEPERLFSWVVQNPESPAATWRFELEPTDGGTKLKQWARLGPGPSFLLKIIETMPDKEDKIVAGRLTEHRNNMLATLEGIKKLAEG
ncbi:SRPBCC family protein [Amycolatopsis sp. cg5]|uniref:SRPBCC family protein n=1 Tax=Amycolatopsis sp. cg5 TaxID=3238802 RepID=UPI003523C781